MRAEPAAPRPDWASGVEFQLPAAAGSADAVEARFEEVTSHRIVGISTEPGRWRLSDAVELHDGGLAVRCWAAGVCRSEHRAAAEPSDELLTTAISAAMAHAGSRAAVPPGLPTGWSRREPVLDAGRRCHSLDVLADLAAEALAIGGCDHGQLTVQLRQTVRRKCIANTAGGWRSAVEPWLSVDLTVHADRQTANRGLAFRPWAFDPAVVASTVAGLWEEVLAPRSAIAPDTYPVVCDPEFAGLLAHEIVGHALEGVDLDAGTHPLWRRGGEPIGGPHVHIRDDPTVAGAFGGYQIDDEGVAPQPVELVEAGRVAGAVHSLISAASAQARPTGHGRSVGWRHSPIPRLSVTYFCPDPAGGSLAELLERTWRGVYLWGARGGSGGDHVAVSSQGARRIERGRLGESLGPLLFVGRAGELLGAVEDIGRDLELHGGGEGGCGKADQFPLAVGAGGPAIRLGAAFLLHG